MAKKLAAVTTTTETATMAAVKRLGEMLSPPLLTGLDVLTGLDAVFLPMTMLLAVLLTVRGLYQSRPVLASTVAVRLAAPRTGACRRATRAPESRHELPPPA